MSQSLAWWRGLVASAIVLCIVFAVGASGQGKSASPFATVDVQKVQSDFKALKSVSVEINDRRTKAASKLSRREEFPFLTDAEHQQLDAIYDKVPTDRTPGDASKIKELETKGHNQVDDIRKLQTIPQKDLKDADTQKIKDAGDQFVKSQQAYNTLKEKLEGEIRDFGTSKSDALTKEVRVAVQKVAEQKGLTIVFNSEVVLYAGTDITQPVLAELNKK